MIPIDDNIRSWQKPIINYWLIGINVVIFLWEIKLEWSNELGNLFNKYTHLLLDKNFICTKANVFKLKHSVRARFIV